MTDPRNDEAAVAALARAIHRAWPARSVDKFAAGWSSLFLAALRSDPEGRVVVVAALLDEETLARALEVSGVLGGAGEGARAGARDILAALSRSD